MPAAAVVVGLMLMVVVVAIDCGKESAIRRRVLSSSSYLVHNIVERGCTSTLRFTDDVQQQH